MEYLLKSITLGGKKKQITINVLVHYYDNALLLDLNININLESQIKFIKLLKSEITKFKSERDREIIYHVNITEQIVK